MQSPFDGGYIMPFCSKWCDDTNSSSWGWSGVNNGMSNNIANIFLIENNISNYSAYPRAGIFTPQLAYDFYLKFDDGNSWQGKIQANTGTEPDGSAPGICRSPVNVYYISETKRACIVSYKID